MEVSAISASINIQSRDTNRSAESIGRRVIENHDSDGDGRLSVQELGNRPELLQRIDSNRDNFADQDELFYALAKRLEKQAGLSIEISLDINVIKASLGNLLSEALETISQENRISEEQSALDVNIRERYIGAIAIDGLDNDQLFSGSTNVSSSDSSNFGNLFSSSQNDGQQLLLDLLVGELGTPRNEAVSILNALQNQSFSIFA